MKIKFMNADSVMEAIEFTSDSPAQAYTILSALGQFYHLNNVAVFADKQTVYHGLSGTSDFQMAVHRIGMAAPLEGTDDDG